MWAHNDAGQLISLPEAWTSLGPADPFVALSQGRAHARVVDLLALAQMVRDLGNRDCKGEYVNNVKKNMRKHTGSTGKNNATDLVNNKQQP